MTHSVEPVGHRERVRAATVEEIKTTARRILIAEGPQAVTLRSIARQMGMTAPALYRYFPSHEDLWIDLCHDTYGEIADALERMLEAMPAADAGERLMAAARAFRTWAVEHPREFGLVFGTPLPGVKENVSPENLHGMRFALFFTQIYVELWEEQRFPVVADEEISEPLRAQLIAYRDVVGPLIPSAAQLPAGAVLRFLQAWVALYGAVTMEVFGHLGFCLEDVSEFFEIQIASIGATLGIRVLDPA